MDSRAQLSTEHRALLDAAIADRCDETMQRRLEQLLRGDATFRRAYVEMMYAVAGVRRYLRSQDRQVLGTALGTIDALGPMLDYLVSTDRDSANEEEFANKAAEILPGPQVSAEPAGQIVPPISTPAIDPAAPGAPASATSIPWEPSTRGASPDVALRSRSPKSVAGWLGQATRFWPYMTAGLAAAGLLLATGIALNDDWNRGAIPTQGDPWLADRQAVAQQRSEDYVARIVLVSPDVAWGEAHAAMDFLLRARAGDKLHVATGLVQVEFDAGAVIILHGPSVFVPTGPASGRLESGRLTGEVSEGDFRLVTPTAEVIDLGTAFGVSADAATGTDVVVFDGRVQAVSRPADASSAEVLDMTEGMAVRFRADGVTEYGLKTDAGKFARRMPPRDGSLPNAICLIDVLAGGDGLGTRLAGAIDPSSGLRDYGKTGRTLEVSGRWSDVVFHPAPWHPLIDGVLIPSADGKRVQVDSLGGRIELPPNAGWTHGSIWARRRESAVEPMAGLDNDFWGNRTLDGLVQRLKQSRLGLVGMHANAGVTFDLRQMQMVHGRTATSFEGLVANLENSHSWTAEERPELNYEFKRTVDFRVFVDGQLKFERRELRREDGEPEFSVPLAAGDRFLTVVATDDDGNLNYDHLVLIDPRIALGEE